MNCSLKLSSVLFFVVGASLVGWGPEASFGQCDQKCRLRYKFKIDQGGGSTSCIEYKYPTCYYCWNWGSGWCKSESGFWDGTCTVTVMYNEERPPDYCVALCTLPPIGSVEAAADSPLSGFVTSLDRIYLCGGQAYSDPVE